MDKLLKFLICTVKSSEWKTNPINSSLHCANQDNVWNNLLPKIQSCYLINNTDDDNIFLLMRNKIIELNPQPNHSKLI